jgi:hypothetical protein
MAKQKEDEISVTGIIAAILTLIIIFALVYWQISSTWESHVKACKELGYSDYEGYKTIYYCSDSDGNYHTVSMKCLGFFSTDCVAKDIKIQSYNP